MPSPRIPDMRAAIRDRLFPSVTTWNRVEGRPRTAEFSRALRADVRDPLWLLARQWQLGEFRAEDAGSPVTAMFHLSTARPTRFVPRDEPPSDLPADLPLEAVAEQRMVRFMIGRDRGAFDLRLAMGRRWLKLIEAGLRPRFIELYPVELPDPRAALDAARVAHPRVWATIQAAAGRLMDGFEFYTHLRRDGLPYDGIDGLTDVQQQALDVAGQRFVDWFQDLIAQPRSAARGAWDATHLEHRFALGAPGDPEQVLTADEYPGGRLDWYSFSVDPNHPPTGASDPTARGAVTRTVLPGPVRYPGMPNSRWWAFEDGRTNFGAVQADTTDLIRLMLLEFALVFSDDWMLLPCDLDVGALAAVDGVAVTDVFGQRFWVEPTGVGQDWQRWGMYRLTGGDVGLFLPDAAPKVAVGPPLEDIVFIRDENANLVWAVERVIPLVTGDGGSGEEAAGEMLVYLRRQHTPQPGPSPAAPIAYRVMTTVPEHWIPFIPVHVPGDAREIQLQRAALPRILDDGPGRPELVRPRTTILREGLDPGTPYFVPEEEVPRAGTRVTVAYNRTRRPDGRPIIWLSVHRESGRGEASSGLTFDHLSTP
ncbi:hypothetical protein E0H75_22285 [Kribbella capetownensis]|uniref:Uncharacterized protein n=1 Tax=Kribbella capetownensis TaxID=1572659 RepID=A0A4R0JLI0_9ACTN|nr:hypothetical protein [Kribbella capetownensis]TCC47509.1 hypothetical protein E0H75_22285 [Kribbella capetownensis]